MSNRMVRHSSRYQGPMGDARPPAEIFAGIEARAVQQREYVDRLTALMDEIMRDATLMMWESRADLIWETTLAWLEKNDPRFREASQ